SNFFSFAHPVFTPNVIFLSALLGAYQHGPNPGPSAVLRRPIQIYQKNLNGGKTDGSYHQL
ncbi:hypothetical protein, partial [Flavonifractor plautii]|uniref:hypothetical protein n=1 Tax=Flavonifractor plautii TaxID=292800 RepID=UPI001A9BC79D